MTVFNAVITSQGAAIQTRQADGDTLHFTKCLTGAGTVDITDLTSQTQVSDIKQEITIEDVVFSADKSYYTIYTVLDNSKLTTPYMLNQVGFYVEDPDSGDDVLFAIAQLTVAKQIVTAAQSPEYSLQMSFTFTVSNSANVKITVDGRSYVTRDYLDRRLYFPGDLDEIATYDGEGWLKQSGITAKDIRWEDETTSERVTMIQGDPVDDAAHRQLFLSTGTPPKHGDRQDPPKCFVKLTDGSSMLAETNSTIFARNSGRISADAASMDVRNGGEIVCDTGNLHIHDRSVLNLHNGSGIYMSGGTVTLKDGANIDMKHGATITMADGGNISLAGDGRLQLSGDASIIGDSNGITFNSKNVSLEYTSESGDNVTLEYLYNELQKALARISELEAQLTWNSNSEN